MYNVPLYTHEVQLIASIDKVAMMASNINFGVFCHVKEELRTRLTIKNKYEWNNYG